jgi:hypothetical protein
MNRQRGRILTATLLSLKHRCARHEGGRRPVAAVAALVPPLVLKAHRSAVPDAVGAGEGAFRLVMTHETAG